MRFKLTKSRRLLAAATLFLFLAGCSDNAENPEGEVLGSPEKNADVSDDAELNTVRVSLVEFQIDMLTTLPPGPTKFVVTNNGQSKHNFEIEGQGIDRVLADEPLKPGEQGVMQINLQPGKYVAYCPVFNHRDRGMQVNLTVTAQQ